MSTTACEIICSTFMLYYVSRSRQTQKKKYNKTKIDDRHGFVINVANNKTTTTRTKSDEENKSKSWKRNVFTFWLPLKMVLMLMCKKYNKLWELILTAFSVQFVIQWNGNIFVFFHYILPIFCVLFYMPFSFNWYSINFHLFSAHRNWFPAPYYKSTIIS